MLGIFIIGLESMIYSLFFFLDKAKSYGIYRLRQYYESKVLHYSEVI